MAVEPRTTIANYPLFHWSCGGVLYTLLGR